MTFTLIRQVVNNTGMLGDKVEFGGMVMTWDGKSADGHWLGVYIHIGRRSSDFGPLGEGGIFLAEEAWPEIGEETVTLVLKGLTKPGSDFYNDHLALEVNLRAITEPGRRDEGDKDLGSDQLLAEVYRDVHRNANGARYTVHRRGCFALMPLLFAPLGFCIGVLARERGRILALLISMAPVFVFYLTDFLGAKLVRMVDWPPIGWMPAVVLFVLGFPFCWRLLRF